MTYMEGRIVFLVGCPGVGKTAITRRVAEILKLSSPARVLHIEVDDLRHISVGKDSESSGAFWETLLEALIERSVATSAWILIEGLFYDPAPIHRAAACYSDVTVLVLEAPVGVCLARNRERPYRDERLPDEEVLALRLVARPDSWIRVEAECGVDDVAEDIARLLMRRVPT